MGTPWTDESAILRDLSFAQGRRVPGEIDSAVAGAQPPAHNIKEETEEEYFRHWSSLEPGGHGDFSAGPDLLEIKTMLELMQDEETHDEEFLSGPIEIRKLNIQAPQFTPKSKNKAENIKPVNKPRRARNVAMASIMALTVLQEPLKLVKPEDFIIPSKEDVETQEKRKDSVNKVTNWLQSQDRKPMFKKKSSVNSFKSPVHSEDSVKSPPSVKSPNGQYTPSSWAQEYYRKAVARSTVRDMVREDVWGRAERAMKEKDAEKEEVRKQAMEATNNVDTAQNQNGDTSPNKTNEAEGIAKILLPASRHELYPATACVVCAILTVPHQDSAILAAPHQDSAILAAPHQDSAILAAPHQDSAILAAPHQDSAILAAPHQDSAILAAPHQDSAILAAPHQDSAILAAPHQDSAILAAPHHDPAILTAPHQDPAILTAPHQDPAILTAPHQDPAILTAPHQDPAILTAPHLDSAILAAPDQGSVILAAPHEGSSPDSATDNESLDQTLPSSGESSFLL